MITAADILKMDTRPIVEIEIAELGLVGDNKAKVRELTPVMMSVINDSCEYETQDGKKKIDENKQMARVIVEGCMEPKWSLSEAEQLINTGSNRGARKLYAAIIAGKKNAVSTS